MDTVGTGFIAAIAATKLELLVCFASGVIYAVLTYLLRPLTMRMTRNEANRVIFSASQNLSTYALMGLGFGAFLGSYRIWWERPLGPQECELASSLGQLSTILMFVCLIAAAIMSRLQMKRLAKQVIALRQTHSTR
jgi:hypothetical protein